MSDSPAPGRRSLTIRKRLALSFSAILILFAADLVVYIWSNVERKAAVEVLRKAIARQILIAEIHQRLNDTQKQVALVSQAVTESPTGNSSDEVSRFKEQLSGITTRVRQLADLSESDSRKRVEAFAKDYQTLKDSWLIFYENFGVNNVKAILELSVRGEPLGQQMLKKTVPELLEGEQRRVETASENFYSAGRIADRLTATTFLLTGLFALFVALGLSRHLTRGLQQLKAGAASIGEGNLDYRIRLRSEDELGDLANTFNHMSGQLSVAHAQLTRANIELAARNREVEQQRELSETLLLNILPSQIADELRINKTVEPKFFEDVSILFTDFVSFSAATKSLSAEKLVHVLHDYFTAFDEITTRYGLEKLKTIGDSYMCVSGMPARTPSHPIDSVLAAFEMLEAMRIREGVGAGWQVRIGIHTGSVAAGVVGIKKFAFDIWGEDVNLSSRMESCGAPNRINVSADTYARIKDFFECEHRGRVLTKDKSAHDMYFVTGVLPELEEKWAGEGPPAAFATRYSAYFQKQLVCFPESLLRMQRETDISTTVS